MRLGTFLMGMVMGIALTVVGYSTMPFHWDSNEYWKKAEKNDGKIVIVVGSDPNARDLYNSYGSVGGPHDDGRWEEFMVVSFKDREDALKLRNDILKVINNARYAGRRNHGE